MPLSTSYAIAEAVGVERSVSRSFREAPLFLGLFTVQILFGASVALIPGNCGNEMLSCAATSSMTSWVSTLPRSNGDG